jgi:uncharacterized protein YodC (DUF2158 family)
MLACRWYNAMGNPTFDAVLPELLDDGIGGRGIW